MTEGLFPEKLQIFFFFGFDVSSFEENGSDRRDAFGVIDVLMNFFLMESLQNHHCDLTKPKQGRFYLILWFSS